MMVDLERVVSHGLLSNPQDINLARVSSHGLLDGTEHPEVGPPGIFVALETTKSWQAED